MGTQYERDHRLVFPGVDALTGRPLESPTTARRLAQRILRLPPDPHRRLEREELESRAEDQEMGPDRRPAPDVDPNSLASAGWAVVFPEEPRFCLGELKEQLEPLLTLRRSEAGAENEHYFRELSYKKGDTKASFMEQLETRPGAAHPDRLPYFILLVGGPDEIPLRFQYLLDMQYAVGRLAFDELKDYGRYARSVFRVEAEGEHSVRGEAAFFSARNAGDPATKRTDEHLVDSLVEMLKLDRREWPVAKVNGGRSDLLELLHGDAAPALLFAAAHGMTYPANHPEQRAKQGSIVCNEWTYGRPVLDGQYVGAADLGNAKIHGMVAFLFGCFSAGTPAVDNFPPEPLQNPRRPIKKPFVSKLAQALLAHPHGGALAVLGHFDRAWTCSFGTGETRGARHVEAMTKYLLDGCRVGHAMDWMNERYAELASELTDFYDERLQPTPHAVDDPGWFANTWRAHNDARNFVVLGDPAVRIPVGHRRALLAGARSGLAEPPDVRRLRKFLAALDEPGVAVSESPASLLRSLAGYEGGG